jgi:hypothetical protein
VFSSAKRKNDLAARIVHHIHVNSVSLFNLSLRCQLPTTTKIVSLIKIRKQEAAVLMHWWGEGAERCRRNVNVTKMKKVVPNHRILTLESSSYFNVEEVGAGDSQ